VLALLVALDKKTHFLASYTDSAYANSYTLFSPIKSTEICLIQIVESLVFQRKVVYMLISNYIMRRYSIIKEQKWL